MKHILKTRTKQLLLLLARSSGYFKLRADLAKTNGALVLMYHSIVDLQNEQWISPRVHVKPDIFEQQIKFLKNKRNVISLEDLLSILKKEGTPERGTIVITFDDGYLDNLTVAAPILEKYKLPATLFVPTALIERTENQWVDQIHSLFQFRTKDFLKWDHKNRASFNLKEPEEFNLCYRSICNEMLGSTAGRRSKIINNLKDQLQPSSLPPRLTMCWNEINTLINQYENFSIGSHTHEHISMTSITPDLALEEVNSSTETIVRMTGQTPKFFSFPYGRTSSNMRKLIAGAGYKCAFGGGGDDPVIKASTNVFKLPRVEAPPTIQQFDWLTDSANTGFWRKLST